MQNIYSYSDISKKIYYNIEMMLNEKKIKKYQLAKKIGVSKQYISDILNDLKNGKPIHMKHFLKIQDLLGENYIFFKY